MEFGKLLIVASVIATVTFADKPQYLIVKTHQGYVRGLKSESRSGRTYTAFKGIQYGVMNNRFQQAVEPEAWKGVKDTLEFGSACPQHSVWADRLSLEENCLFLNVYMPERGSNQKPVIFYIHGGGWMEGGGDQLGEKFFMDEDVILVTSNYRLGAFGFLAIQDAPDAYGNMAFYDMLLGLKWVHANIHKFAGDPQSVTIMGESAGAGSVANFLLSPLTKGLFHKAIHHSGSSLNPWTWRPIEEAESTAIRLGENLGCDTSSKNQLVKCLREKTVEEMLKAQAAVTKFALDHVIEFIPVVNKRDPNSFFPESPVDLLQHGKFNRVPTILTACEREGLMVHAAKLVQNEELINALNLDWVKNSEVTNYLEKDSGLRTLSEKQKEEILLAIRRHYFGETKLQANHRWTLDRFEELYTDRYFLHGIRETALVMSEHTSVYVGMFTDVGADSVMRLFGYNETLGVAHTDDLQFFFDNFGLGLWPMSESVTEYSKELVKVWVNFAKTGIPSGIVNGKEFEWNQVTEEERSSRRLSWLNLGRIPNVIENPFADRLKIWDQIYLQYGHQIPAGHEEL